MINFKLQREKTGLIIVDVQDRLFGLIERSCEILLAMQKVIKGFQVMNLPIVTTEQYPAKLGPTIATIKALLPDDQQYPAKTTFSAMRDAAIRRMLLEAPVEQWVIIGIEAHVCILQTAKDLLMEGRQVTVLNDAISSRSIYDFSTAIAELRDCGARVSSVETVLFELIGDSKSPDFKDISQLIK